MDSINSDNDQTEKKVNFLTKAASRLKETISATTLAIKDMFSADYLSGLLISSFQDAVSELREIDRIINQIKKSDRSLTKEELAGFKTKALEASARYGISSTDYLSDILEITQAGYKNADQIAELSTALQNTADISSDTALGIITMTDSAWSLGGSVTELTKILNGLLGTATIGAVNMSQLAESFSLASESAAGFGAGSDRIAAAAGTLILAAGMDAREAADALSSLISVIGGSYQTCLNTGSDTADSFAAACGKLGVSLSETKNGITSLRDPIQIVNELAGACSRLSETGPARTELFNAINSSGGDLAVDAFEALIQNSSVYSKMLDGYSDMDFSIIHEAEENLSSLDGALNRLSGTWTQTIGNITDSKAAASLVNTAGSLLNVVNGITSALGPIGTIGLGAGSSLFVKNFA